MAHIFLMSVLIIIGCWACFGIWDTFKDIVRIAFEEEE